MKLRILPPTMVALVLLCANPTLLAAAPSNPNSTDSLQGHAAKIRKVAFQVRNSSPAAITVQAGESELQLQPGQAMAVKLPVGVQLTAKMATPHYTAGELLAVVGNDLAGNVLVFH